MQYQVQSTDKTQENNYFRNENESKSLGSSKNKLWPWISRERNKILTSGFFQLICIVLLHILRRNEQNRKGSLWEKAEKPLFWPHFRTLWMNRNFFGQTAVHVSSSYHVEHLCKKSKKSLEPFLRKAGD